MILNSSNYPSLAHDAPCPLVRHIPKNLIAVHVLAFLVCLVALPSHVFSSIVNGARAVKDDDRLAQKDGQLDSLAKAQQLKMEIDRLYSQHKLAEAVEKAKQRLEICERVLGADHPETAETLTRMGSLLRAQGLFSQARPLCERAVRILDRLYPEQQYPQGDAQLAESLTELGFLFRTQGLFGPARHCYERALRMCERLYPQEQHPQGHHRLATVLSNLAVLLSTQGEPDQALQYHKRAVAVLQRLYPAEEYRNGHVELARGFGNLGVRLARMQEFDQALQYCTVAAEMCQRLFPADEYPKGHFAVAKSLSSLGEVLQRRGEYDKAQIQFERAFSIFQNLYPREDYSRGHPELAITLDDLGQIYQSQGQYDRAEQYFLKAVEMNERLFAREQYPYGHRLLAVSLNHMGRLYLGQGLYERALRHLERALVMYQDLADEFYLEASEAEGLNFASSLPLTRDYFLTASRFLSQEPEQVYRHVWRGKAALSRVMARRQHALVQSAAPQVQTLWDELQSTRRELSQLASARVSPESTETRLQQLQSLTDQKESFERQLAQLIPEFARDQALAQRPHTDLAESLPHATAFVDFLRYASFEQVPAGAGNLGDKGTPSYLAFVIRRGETVARVELGSAEPIDIAISRWRMQLDAPKESEQGGATAELRQLLWAPIEKHLSGITTVLISPDGALTRLPWAALPGRAPDTVLLEQYAIALVPHGPFLLEQLNPAPSGGAGMLLTVGDVSYDDEVAPIHKSIDVVAYPSPVVGDDVRWTQLPGAAQEAETIAGLFRNNVRPVPQVVSLSGAAASAARVLQELPKARWAHLATHGFFADAKFHGATQVDRATDAQKQPREQPAGPGRNPLLLSGVVLAGANRTTVREGQSDHGIITAEMIAGLPLHNLDLIVLSACDTGLGDVAGGEGCFGLQRSFALAGTRSVIASLWKVSDVVTQDLMAEFYQNLWEKKLEKLAALREAQLKIRTRGPGDSSHPRYWAGWILSGDPGDLTRVNATIAAVGTPERVYDDVTASESPFDEHDQRPNYARWLLASATVFTVLPIVVVLMLRVRRSFHSERR